jgi:hypothetical protein
MRLLRRIMSRHLCAATMAVVAAAPAAAQPTTNLDLSIPAAGVPVTAPFRKPGTPPPAQPIRPETEGCVPGLPCGTQLYGNGRRRSTIELQVPAWRS